MSEIGPRKMRQSKFENNELLQGLLKAASAPMEVTGGETFLSLLIERLVTIESLVLQIGNSQADLFEIKAGRVIAANTTGEKIHKILAEAPVLFDGYRENFQFCPNVMLFMEEFEKIEPRKLIWFGQDTKEGARTICDKLNGAVSAIREKVKTTEFREQICNFRRSADKNVRSFQLYTRKCFELHSRLLVLRVDLSYKKEAFSGKSFAESFEMAKQHWKKWIRRFKRRTGKAYVGFAKIIEYRMEGLFDFHVLLLLDGARARQDVLIATHAEEDWSEVVTRGVGRSHNYNVKQDTGHLVGIGMVRADDKERRAALDEMMTYMNKVDYFVKLVTPDGSRVFSKGDMPKAKAECGRPRKNFTVPAGVVGEDLKKVGFLLIP